MQKSYSQAASSLAASEPRMHNIRGRETTTELTSELIATCQHLEYTGFAIELPDAKTSSLVEEKTGSHS